MRMAVAWVDPGLAPQHLAPWPDGSDGATLVVGPHAGPEMVAWLDERQIGAVLLVGRTTSKRPLHYVANVITGARRNMLVATRTVPCSALAALAHASRVVGLDTDPSSRIAAFDTLAARDWSGAWLKSVVSMSGPNPGFGQYVRSMFPGGPRFVAVLGPEPGIHKAAVAIADAPASGRLLVGPGAEETVVHALRATFPGLELQERPGPPIRDAYGSAGVEFVVDDGAPVPLPGPAAVACRVCRQPLHQSACPFCHVVTARSVHE
ncbi:MAG: hypothetical protein QM708_04545 [Propioniciclava sp.]|uniref:hypothetical protein n=1 Tax=Propioniciclava sp. TaxID=2038686 RepID=UPI0039E45C1A